MSNDWNNNQLGWWPQSNPNSNICVIVDLAAVLRAYSQGMISAYELGKKARIAAQNESSQINDYDSQVPPELQQGGAYQTNSYYGVYDRYAYGFYSDRQAFNKSEPYWDGSTIQMQEFQSAEEALSFAQNGVAMLRHMDVSQLPDMQYPINWRQRIK